MSEAPKQDQESKKEDKDEEVLKTFDMYHFFSRWDVIFIMAFLIGFLIFALAIQLTPQPV